VYLPINGPWEDFYQSKSRKFRMTRRSVANKISRLGDIKIECAANQEELRPALDAMLELGARGWKRRTNRDLLDERLERQLLSSLVEWGGKAKSVRIWLLCKDGRPVASEFHLVDGKTVYGLRAQYDPEYFSYSPGRALDYEIVERLFHEGFAAYDMGPGVVEYKRNWTEVSYSTVQVDGFAPNFYPQLVGRIHYDWAPALKRTRVGQWFFSRWSRKCPSQKTGS
jgi:CelD/BcsL family acetyltransferase involved in cellulose biosynthesis